MGLSEFIATHIDQIAAEYEDFARSLTPAAAQLDRLLLRDHVEPILQAIAADMQEPQSHAQQAEKAKGHAARTSHALTAAELHGNQRAGQGFNIQHAVAEYRALRASVIRLWLAGDPRLDRAETSELIRFNEAIDQALSESVLQFAIAAAHDRTLFMGVLSHELRTPLATIVASAHVLGGSAEQDRFLCDVIARMLRAAGRIESILDDMLDFVRGETQGGMRIQPVELDFDALGARVVQDLQSTHPGRVLEFRPSGNALGRWDEQRLAQALSNLINNALKYGDAHTPVRLRVSAEGDDQIVASVHNQGAVISHQRLESFFQPLVRGEGTGKADASLGLGLYIVRAIAAAHGGEVRAESLPSGETIFSLVLPRHFGGSVNTAFGTLGMH